MIYDGMVHILVFGMLWAPKKAKIDQQLKEDQAKLRSESTKNAKEFKA